MVAQGRYRFFQRYSILVEAGAVGSGVGPLAGLTRVGFLERSAWGADREASPMIAFPSASQAAPKVFVPKNLPV